MILIEIPIKIQNLNIMIRNKLEGIMIIIIIRRIAAITMMMILHKDIIMIEIATNGRRMIAEKINNHLYHILVLDLDLQKISID